MGGASTVVHIVTESFYTFSTKIADIAMTKAINASAIGRAAVAATLATVLSGPRVDTYTGSVITLAMI